MIEFVDKFSLWGALILCSSVLLTYHFSIIVKKYLTDSEIQKNHYKKSEIDVKLNKLEEDIDKNFKSIEHSLSKTITEKDINSLKELIDLRFDNQDKILSHLSDQLLRFSKLTTK